MTRLDADLHDAFVRIVEADERSISSELRRLIRARVAQHDDGPQASGPTRQSLRVQVGAWTSLGATADALG